MKRKLAAGLTAVFLSSVLFLQPAAAQEQETEIAPAQETAETEGAGEAPEKPPLRAERWHEPEDRHCIRHAAETDTVWSNQPDGL